MTVQQFEDPEDAAIRQQWRRHVGSAGVGTRECTDMRHPVEMFDTPAPGAMASALNAAVATVRLSGVEPDDGVRWAMAQRIITAARLGDKGPLALAEAALDGPWS